MTATDLDEAEKNWTPYDAVEAGLFVAEWSLWGTFVRAYGVSEAQAVERVLAKRDLAATVHVTNPRRQVTP